MILINVNNEGKINSYHENPDVLSEADISKGILVDTIPEVEQRFGERGALMYDEVNNLVFVKYVDRPLTTEEQMQELKDSVDYMILQNEGLV